MNITELNELLFKGINLIFIATAWKIMQIPKIHQGNDKFECL